MTVSDAARETRRTTRALDVAGFRRIELRDPVDWVDLVVVPGGSHALEVEGPEGVVRRIRAQVDGETLRITLGGGLLDRARDTITTSLTREHVTYRVRAPRVDEVRVLGLVRVGVDAFGPDAPVVTRLRPAAPEPPARPGPPEAPRPG